MEGNIKATGLIRRVDDLGRVVIPKEIRKKLGFDEYQQLEICVMDEYIILRKYGGDNY